jgi:hypothetical protein
MHLLIPFASALGGDAALAIKELALPELAKALRSQPATARLGSDEYSLTPPHELAMAGLWGWQGADGALPFAARHAQRDGVAVGDLCWAELTPLHLRVGAEQVSAIDTAALKLDAEESRALFAALAELFPADEGWTTAWGAPLRWYVAHASMQGLPGASLDRVLGRSVDPWMPEARRLRTLQNEAQMLLHNHAVNAAREARGELAVNSVWISGCGAPQALPGELDLRIDWRLRAPLLAGDWASWTDAWRALDAGPVHELVQLAAKGQVVHLTLCGERFAQSYRLQPRRWWQRWWGKPQDSAAVLESL